MRCRASSYGVDKAAVLDKDTKGSMAVRLALGETHIVADNKLFLQSEGVRLDVRTRTYTRTHICTYTHMHINIIYIYAPTHRGIHIGTQVHTMWAAWHSVLYYYC